MKDFITFIANENIHKNFKIYCIFKLESKLEKKQKDLG